MSCSSCLFLSPSAQASSRELDSFVASHQDRSKNALSRANEASYVAWVEELKADKAQFDSERITCPGFIQSNLFNIYPDYQMELASVRVFHTGYTLYTSFHDLAIPHVAC